MVKSHIQMPKLILKNFAGDNGQLYYYEYKSGVIKRGYPASLDVEYGYYSEYTEKYLSDEIETRLGLLVKFLKTTSFQNQSEVPEDYRSVAFDYLYSLISRAPSMINSINKNSIFFQFLSEKDKHDITAINAFDMMRERQLLYEYKVSFIDNKSSEGFVLPAGGVTQYHRRDLFCPITPNKAVVFELDDYPDNNATTVYEEVNNSTIKTLNRLSYAQEKERDKKYIVSNSKTQLENLISTCKYLMKSAPYD